jgi:hypothetical protein
LGAPGPKQRLYRLGGEEVDVITSPFFINVSALVQREIARAVREGFFFF